MLYAFFFSGTGCAANILRPLIATCPYAGLRVCRGFDEGALRGRISLLVPKFMVAEVTSFYLGPWLVEVPLNRLRNNGATIQLEPKIMQVLVRLAETPGEVVRKEELIRSVWADTFVTDDVLTRSISELRKALEDDARQPRCIETIPRSGYRLLVASTAAQAEAAYGNLGLPQTARPFTPQRPTSKAIAGAVAALAALAVALVWWMWPEPAPALTGYKQLTSDGERKI